jgi:holo-[acyl-carrier protein] synthase
MIVAIGTDLIEISRIRAAHERWGDRFLRRIFTEEEIGYVLSRSDPAPSMAARFAAKEAGAKALGTGISRGVHWRQIFVTRTRGNPPALNFAGRAAEIFARCGPGARVHLSLTHARDLAQAIVIIERD